MNKILKKIVYELITKLIIFNLIVYKKFINKNNIYFKKIAFGDTFVNYIENYDIIKKKKLKLLVLSKLEKKIANFFFDNHISTILFLIPSFIPVYSICSLLNTSSRQGCSGRRLGSYSILNKINQCLIKFMMNIRCFHIENTNYT